MDSIEESMGWIRLGVIRKERSRSYENKTDLVLTTAGMEVLRK
jgi:hypothetical protein